MTDTEKKIYNQGVQAAIQYVLSNARGFSSVDSLENRIHAYPYLTEMAEMMQELKK